MVVYFDFHLSLLADRCCYIAILLLLEFFGRLRFHQPIHHKFSVLFCLVFLFGLQMFTVHTSNLSNQMLMFALSTLNCAHHIPCMPTTRKFWMLRVFMRAADAMYHCCCSIWHAAYTSVWSIQEKMFTHTHERSSAIDM